MMTEVVSGLVDAAAARARSGADAAAFGKAVFGPIFAEFALRLWLFLQSLEEPDDTCILFCARGGLRLQFVFERFLRRTGLVCPVTANPLMVSRLIAARPALLRDGAAALDELEREFHGRSMADAAAALTQNSPPSEPEWQGSFERLRFCDLVLGEHPAARLTRSLIEAQHALFAAHLTRVSHGKRRVVLCDTGLFGSTLKLLGEGMPEREWGCVLLARSNYKGFGAEHFSRVCGLSLEGDRYSPFDPRTSLLRYWQLIEWMLEPRLPSVTTFALDDGEPRSNLEIAGWRDRVPPEGPGLFSGVVDYVDELPAGSFFAEIDGKSRPAWRALKRAVIFPSQADVARLSIDDRSHDFGRSGAVPVFAPEIGAGFFGRLRMLPQSLWREGAVTRSFRLLRGVLLVAIETAYIVRWLHGWVARRSRRNFGVLQIARRGTPRAPVTLTKRAGWRL